MNTYIIAKIITSSGLLLDAIGACFVAYEVVNQYKGKKFHTNPSWNDMKDHPKETDEYKTWAESKYVCMKTGIILLILGFSLQIFACWLPYLFKNNDKPNITNATTITKIPVIQIKETPNIEPATSKATPTKNKEGIKTKKQNLGEKIQIKKEK